MKLFFVILFVVALPALSRDTVTFTVNRSSLLRACEESIQVLSFDEYTKLYIVNDVSVSPNNDLPAFSESKPAAEKPKIEIQKVESSASQKSIPSGKIIYGFNSNGDYFLAKEVVGDSVAVEVSYPPYWGRHKMSVDGDYYVFHSSKKLSGVQLYCFYVDGKQLPQSILSWRKLPSSPDINWSEIVMNYNGENNFFYTSPREVVFK